MKLSKPLFQKEKLFSFLARAIGITILAVPSITLIRSEQTAAGTVLSALGIAAVFIFFLGLTWRLGLGGLLSGALLFAIVKIYQLKSDLMGQTFLWAADIFFFFDQFAANISILLRYEGLAKNIIVAVSVLVISAVLFGKAERPLGSWSHSKIIVLRLSAVLFSIFLIPAAFFIINSTNNPFFSSLKKPSPRTLIFASGNILSTFILSYAKMGITMPDRQFPDLQESRLMFDSEPPQTTVSEYPDIILWHNESTFDPALLEACNVPECQFNLFKSDRYTVSDGLLKVNTFGGASWTTEFAILTGLNHTLFGEGGLYTHFTLAPRVTYSLPLQLKKRGYRTVALYPNTRHFFNANNAYRYYGFDEFYALEDLGLPNNPWQITDRVMYEKMAEIVRRHSSGPIFVYVLTQFQHAPHDQPVQNLPEPYKSLRLAGLSDQEQVNLANYLYRMSLTDSVIAELENRFLKASDSRKTVFVHYGDHQPSFDNLMPKMAKRGFDRFPSQIQLTLTQYSIKANFPPVTKESHEYLDVSFLASSILDSAGIPKDKFFAANSKLRKLCGGKYVDCAKAEVLGKYHDYIFYELGVMR